jgi:tetratricopeptide (TPR) repeat protein
MVRADETGAPAETNVDGDAWSPRFLCHSFSSPIILSDGVVTSCTHDHRGRNRVGSIFEDDFDALIERFGRERLDAMAAPLAKPLCHACYTRLPRWRDRQVPRAAWLDERIDGERKLAYRRQFDPSGLSFNIELSSACNLRCIGCALADPAFRSSRGAPNIDLDRLMAWLDGHVMRIAHVRLYHMGETWLHPRWFEFCRFLKTRNPALTLFTSTNGMPLDSEDKLVRVCDSGIDHVMFSIHGATKASSQAYMGTAFDIDAALAAVRRLVELRQQRRVRLHLSWKYLLFAWNDSDDEIETAKRLCDEVGFDELHFSITSQPAPSPRYTLDGANWAAMRQACAEAWARAADYQQRAPMTAVYPGQRQRQGPVRWKTVEAGTASTPSAPAKAAPVIVLPTPAGDLARRGRELLSQGHVLEAVRVLDPATGPAPRPTAALHKVRGDALSAAGRAADAVQAYAQALRLDPAQRTEHLQLAMARALRASGRLAEAESAYEAALRLRESTTPGLYGEDVYLELRDTSLALGHRLAAENAWRAWKESTWLLDPRGRTVYCPIAKNACTFMKAALVLNSAHADAFRASAQDAHVYTRSRAHGLRLGDARLASDPRYFSFVLLRDPFERLASAYGYVFVRPLQWREVPDAPGQAVVNAVHLRQGREPDWKASISFDAFVREIVGRADADMDHHWRPQCAFFDAATAFDHVGRVECLDETLDELRKRRHWQFEFDPHAVRNALRRSELAPARYDLMLPRQLALLPGVPTAGQLFTDELRALVARRYAEDLQTHDGLKGDRGPVYPTGGALAFGDPAEAGVARARRPAAAPADEVATGVKPAPRELALAALKSAPHAPQPPAAAGLRTLVAGPEGRPGADGTAASPLPLAQALQQAFEWQAQGLPARVCLLDGTYREPVRVTGRRDAAAPLTIEAAPGATPVFSGADLWTDWARSGDGHWVHAWDLGWGPAPAPDDYGDPWLTVPALMLRREMVLFDGQRMRQVLAADALVPGTFLVDDDARRLVLCPPAGTAPGTARIEMAVRQTLFELRQASRVTLRGLHWRHDAGAAFVNGSGALRLIGCERVRIEDCSACDNNHKGIQLEGGCRDVVLRRVRMNHNGCLGLLAARAQGLRLEECETSFNNWRGVWAGYYRGSPCGLKIWRSRDVQLYGHRSLHNQATGIWIDEDNVRVTVERAHVVGNRRGIHVEAGDGPVDIVECSVLGNRQEPLPDAFRWAFGSGVVVTHARGVTVRDCLLAGNDVAQVGVREDRAVRRITLAADQPVREFHAADLRLHRNTIVADTNGTWLRLPDMSFDGGRFLASLDCADNRYVGEGQQDGIVLVARGEHGIERRRLTLPQWQARSGHDKGSTVDGCTF